MLFESNLTSLAFRVCLYIHIYSYIKTCITKRVSLRKRIGKGTFKCVYKIQGQNRDGPTPLYPKNVYIMLFDVMHLGINFNFFFFLRISLAIMHFIPISVWIECSGFFFINYNSGFGVPD